MIDSPEVTFGNPDPKQPAKVKRSSAFTVFVDGKRVGRIYRYRMGSWLTDEALTERLRWTFDDRREFARKKIGLPDMRNIVRDRVLRLWVRDMVRNGEA